MRDAALFALALTLAGCSANTPATTAAGVTRAVYDDNASGIIARADSSIAKKISRASVGVLSDEMHALGAYGGLTQLASDPAKHEYTYRANFSKGTMNIVVRLDADGKLAAYRVFPQS